jgi:hypothetical protein
MPHIISEVVSLSITTYEQQTENFWLEHEKIMLLQIAVEAVHVYSC